MLLQAVLWGLAAAACLPGGKPLTLHVHDEITTVIEGHLCHTGGNFSQDYPNVGVEAVELRDLFGYNNDDAFTFLQNMLHEGQAGYDVMSLDTQWVTTVSEDLVELDVDPSLIREKWRLHTSPSGKLYTVTRSTNQLVMFYRKDLFDRYDLTWPATWEEFDTTVLDLLTRLRAGNSPSDPSWGFTLPIDANSQNRIIYVLISLLSGHGAGTVVEADGNITINTPEAVRTMAMWKNWIGTICPPDAYGHTSSAAYNYFAEGKSAVLLHWSSSSTGLTEIAKNNPSWDIAMAPIPGAKGAGCSGDWSVGINRHTPLREEAMSFVQRYSQDFSFFEVTGAEPMRADVMARPGFWDDFHARNPMLATSMQTYPEFWDRLAHRPSAGCKALYGDCINIVFKHVTDFFVSSDLSPEAAVAGMEADLQRLLGVVSLSVGNYSQDEWSDTRVAMVAVICIACVFLVVIGVVIKKTAWSLRANSMKIPVSLLLGLVAVASFGTVLGVVVTRNDQAIRGISEDLSERLRQQSMLALEISVQGTIEGLVEQSKATWAMVKQRALGNIRQDIGRMRAQPLSLIVVIDRLNKEILLSNDETLQPIGVFANGTSANPWVLNGLRNVDNWDTALIDPERSWLYASKGGDVYANMLNIKKSASGIDSTYISYNVDWLLMYMTPHEVIMGEAEAAYDEAIDLSVILALVGLVVLLACAVVITHPFVKLVHDMKLVENMEMELIVQRDSMLLEVSALLGGFYAMCNILNEYKAYMPATLFQKSDSETEEDSASRTSRSSRSVHTAPTVDAPAGTNVVTQLRMSATLKSISLVSVSYSGNSANDVTQILDAISYVTTGSNRGAMLATTGDQSVIGLNIATHLVSHIMKSAQCGLMLKERLEDALQPTIIGIGCATGKATVASCGSMAIKAFTALGRVSGLARYLSEEACELGAWLLLESSVAQVVNGNVDVLPVGVLPPAFKLMSMDAVVYRAGGYCNAENEEWMYSYARSSSDNSALAMYLSALSVVTTEEENRRTIENIEAHWASHCDGAVLPPYLQEALRRLRNKYCSGAF